MPLERRGSDRVGHLSGDEALEPHVEEGIRRRAKVCDLGVEESPLLCLEKEGGIQMGGDIGAPGP